MDNVWKYYAMYSSIVLDEKNTLLNQWNLFVYQIILLTIYEYTRFTQKRHPLHNVYRYFNFKNHVKTYKAIAIAIAYVLYLIWFQSNII